MANYIGCRNCDPLYCDNCNIYILATMLREGKLDCLMDERHCITIDPANLRTKGEWKSIEDRLPAYGQHVIVYTGRMMMAEVSTTYFWNEAYDAWQPVSHWMPLPEPPNCGADMRDETHDS